MTDHLSQKHRSWNMSRIRSKHSKPEVLLRSLLHRAGLRFRVNCKKLPGCPDVVFPKYRVAIFVHGCFWHRHKKCCRATTPSTNKEYWVRKFQRNVARDKEVQKELKEQGWTVTVVWECEIIKTPLKVLSYIIEDFKRRGANIYDISLTRNEILQVAEKRSKYLIEKEGKKV